MKEVRPGLLGAVSEEEPVQDQGTVEAGFWEIGIEADGFARGGEGADEKGRLVSLLGKDGEGRRKVTLDPGILWLQPAGFLQRRDCAGRRALVRPPEEVRDSLAVEAGGALAIPLILSSAESCAKLLSGRTPGRRRVGAVDPRKGAAFHRPRGARRMGETAGETGLDESPLPYRAGQAGGKIGSRKQPLPNQT